MTRIAPMQVEVSTRPPHARRGAVLVLVLFVIVLASALAVLATRYSVELARTTRHYHESILLQQMIDSAQAWLAETPNWREHVPVDLAFIADVTTGAGGDVRIDRDDDKPDMVIVTARLSLIDRELSRTVRFKAPP